MIDVMRLATRETDTPAAREVAQAGYISFAVDPTKMYPAIVEHILLTLESKTRPDGALDKLYRDALALSARAWELALTPLDEVDAIDLKMRAKALECGRKWFTELLHRAAGCPMRLHILNTPGAQDFRLFPKPEPEEPDEI